MDRLIYTALSGMRASMDQQRVLANNMANARTPGFRAELMQRTPVTLESDQLEVRAQQSAVVTGARMEAGELMETGQPLDIAVTGDALIAVQAPDGSEAYTRRGDLSVSPSGLLVNGAGHPMLGASGPVTVPLSGSVSIADDGAVMVTDPAQPDAPPQEIARIKLAGWQGSPIAKGLDNLFRVEGGGILPVDEAARVKPGFLEQSNVKSTEVLVEMIEAQRLFEMRTKLLSTAKELDEQGSGLMRLT
ncbi:MAG: flagellar basal body rod protein FlgF [Sphingomonadaceae bacterium]|nr:flagellar basal body rod protein FlgF [Sphingomonadaceae bacterium]